jgi:hypothetical protein
MASSSDRPLREHFVDHRNQSIGEVVRRLCWRGHRYPVAVQLASLAPPACRRTSAAIALALAAGLVWATRKRRAHLNLQRLRGEVACYALAMMVFSPLLRQYYLVWALPGLVLFAQMARGGTARRSRYGSWSALLLWILGMIAWASEEARSYGVHLMLLISLGLLLLVATARGARDERADASQDGGGSGNTPAESGLAAESTEGARPT